MTQRQVDCLPPVCPCCIPEDGMLCCLSYDLGFHVIEVRLIYIGDFGYYQVPMDPELSAVVMHAFITDAAERLLGNHTLH
jgi:hypothetical protein